MTTTCYERLIDTNGDISSGEFRLLCILIRNHDHNHDGAWTVPEITNFLGKSERQTNLLLATAKRRGLLKSRRENGRMTYTVASCTVVEDFEVNM